MKREPIMLELDALGRVCEAVRRHKAESQSRRREKRERRRGFKGFARDVLDWLPRGGTWRL